MRTKELKIMAREEKILLCSVQRFHKNLKHHGHTYNLPSDISQHRPRKFSMRGIHVKGIANEAQQWQH